MAAAFPELPGRLHLPELARADETLELLRQCAPLPLAPLADFRAWSDLCAAARLTVSAIQTRFASELCHFCTGFATIAGQPCLMCEATGLSAQRRQAIRSHHNGE